MSTSYKKLHQLCCLFTLQIIAERSIILIINLWRCEDVDA